MPTTCKPVSRDVYKRQLHTQPNRKLFDVMLQGSGDARMQPLYFLITTAGNDTNSICYEVHQKAIDIAEGRKVDPTFYSVIYGAAEDEDWTDPKVWKKANPSLGITVGDVYKRQVENGIPPEDIFVERNGEQIPYSALVKEVEI